MKSKQLALSAILGGCIALLALIGCLAITTPHPDRWPVLILLCAIAVGMEVIALESGHFGVRFTFSLPYVAAVTVAIGGRQGLMVEVLIAVVMAVMAYATERQWNAWALAWNRAIGFIAFGAGLLVYHWLRAHISTSPLASLEVVGFMVAYVAIDLVGLACLQGIAAISGLAQVVADSNWLAISMVGFYVLIGLMAASLAFDGNWWLMPITAIPGLALRAGISYRIKMIHNYEDTIAALALMLQRAHPYTHGHVDRVADTAQAVGRKLGLSRNQAHLLRTAAILHDIGKIAIDETILDKPGRLTQEEFDHVKLHAEFGSAILEPVRELHEIAEWVRFHHERPDGSGYPLGLTGIEIPIESKIIAVVDAFDAMTGGTDSNAARPYQRSMTVPEAMEELRRCSGTQFDIEVVEAFCSAYRVAIVNEPHPVVAGLGDAFA